ncbi:MAG: M16 family metallopeptidase, partial [Bacillota bacterium]
ATRKSVRDVARQVLTPKARLILRVVPELQGTDTAALETRPATPPEAKFTPQMPQTFVLSNGIKVMHWQRSELPLVHLSMLLGGGAGLDSPDHAGCAHLAAQMLNEGAGERDALAFSDAMQMLGASFDAHVAQENTSLGLSVLKRNLKEAMGLYADAVLRPRFDAKEFERVRALHVDGLKQAEDEPAVVASRVGLRAFFGDAHAYGRPVDGTVSSVQSLALEDIRKAYARIAAPANAVFFVAGDLTAEETKSLLEEAFGQWKAPAGWAPIKLLSSPEVASQSMRVVIVDKPDSVQTVIGFYMPGPTYRTPDRMGLQMVNRILGGSFTSRLVQNLREKNGFTYGVRSRFVMGRSAGYFTAATSVQAKVTGAALKEFLAELKRIRSGDITDAEAFKTKQMQRAEVVESFQGLAGIVGTAQVLESNGLPFSTLGDDLAGIQPISTTRLNELAGAAIPLDRALLVLVGDKQVIEAQIKGLGLPTAMELTASGEAKERR